MYMATCSLDVVHTHGLAALCRLMYSQEGSPKCTREDGGVVVEYQKVASGLWDRIKSMRKAVGKWGVDEGPLVDTP